MKEFLKGCLMWLVVIGVVVLMFKGCISCARDMEHEEGVNVFGAVITWGLIGFGFLCMAAGDR